MKHARYVFCSSPAMMLISPHRQATAACFCITRPNLVCMFILYPPALAAANCHPHCSRVSDCSLMVNAFNRKKKERLSKQSLLPFSLGSRHNPGGPCGIGTGFYRPSILHYVLPAVRARRASGELKLLSLCLKRYNAGKSMGCEPPTECR